MVWMIQRAGSSGCTPDFLYYCDHNIASRKINLSQTATNPVKKTKMKEKMTMMTKRQMGKAGRRRSWWVICLQNSRFHFADDTYTQDISASDKAVNDKIEAIEKKWKCRDAGCPETFCWINGDGKHIVLDYDIRNFWGSGIVCAQEIYMDDVYTCLGWRKEDHWQAVQQSLCRMFMADNMCENSPQWRVNPFEHCLRGNKWDTEKQML